MAVFISEHPSDASHRQPATKAATAFYELSSASAATLQGGTKFVRAVADAGSFLNNSTTSGTLTLTSTNSWRLPANVPEIFAVSTGNKLQAAST
jgi:hypothetical protein